MALVSSAEPEGPNGNWKFHPDIRKYFFTQQIDTVWNSLPKTCNGSRNTGGFQDQARYGDTMLDTISLLHKLSIKYI